LLLEKTEAPACAAVHLSKTNSTKCLNKRELTARPGARVRERAFVEVFTGPSEKAARLEKVSRLLAVF
jgi:hypothetical protein